MPWPEESAPDLALRGFDRKDHTSAHWRNEALYRRLHKRVVGQNEEHIPTEELKNAVTAIDCLEPEDTASFELWTALGRKVSRLSDEDDIQNALLGNRVTTAILDEKLGEYLIRQKNISGPVMSQGSNVSRSFSMSDDPVLNRDRARRGMLCRFIKKEALKEWGDLMSHNFESTPFGPLFVGCYLGWIAGIGENKIYILALVSMDQRGIEAVDAELKKFYHMVYPEGASYEEKEGEGRPVFVRGLPHYEGRMVGTHPIHEVRYEDYLEIVPDAGLTEESFVYMRNQLQDFCVPEKNEDMQIQISEEDAAWYKDAGCPKSGEKYEKDANGVLRRFNIVETPSRHQDVESMTPEMGHLSKSISVSSDSQSPDAQTCTGAQQIPASQPVEVSAANLQPNVARQEQDPRLVPSTTSAVLEDSYASDDSEYAPETMIETAQPQSKKKRTRGRRSRGGKNKNGVLGPQSTGNRVQKQGRRPDALSEAAKLLAQDTAENGDKAENGGIQPSDTATVHPDRMRLIRRTLTETATAAGTNRLKDRGIDGTNASEDTKAGAMTATMQRTMLTLEDQTLHDSRARSEGRQ